MKIFGFQIKREKLPGVVITTVALGYILVYLVLHIEKLIAGVRDVFKAFI